MPYQKSPIPFPFLTIPLLFVAAKVMLKKWGKPVLGTRSDRINIHNALHDYLYFEDYPGCLWFAVGW
jgi:hypothetical protein